MPYPQALEGAVEQAWVHDQTSEQNWMSNVMSHNLGHLDGQVFLRLWGLARGRLGQHSALEWPFFSGPRESSELLLEDQHQAGRCRLLGELENASPGTKTAAGLAAERAEGRHRQ